MLGAACGHFRWLGMSLGARWAAGWAPLRPKESGHVGYLVQ
ncbi:hypothetical protein I544_2346 [Mycobacteroides abscessus subsp. bolletii 103]|nr:hypothetical protein I544_2346 [Mycobacteroides abscessus subsp. bolletii 103]